MGTRTASPRGRYGERPQRDSVWRYIWKNTTCWPATAHDVTTGVPQYKCRRAKTSSAFSSSLTGLFEACRMNLVRVQFSNSTMASTSKAFRSVSSLFDTRWHTRLLRLLFGHGARTRCPWGGGLRALWAALYEEAQLSPVPLFEERGAAVCFPRCGTHRCRGTEVMKLAVGCGRWMRKKRGTAPFRARRPRTRVSCWIVMMRSFWHHQMQQLVLRCIWTSFWRLWIIKINLNNPQLEWAFLSS